MRTFAFRALMASTILCLSLPAVGASSPANAQTAAAMQAAPNGADDAGPAAGQAAMTEKQIVAIIAAQKTINAIVEKIPEDQMDNPNPRIQAMLDKAAKKAGFRDYGEYDDIANNITFILEGFDPRTKTYVGAEVVLKQQIAEIGADRKLSAKDKAAQIAELNDELKSVEPVQFPANIALVSKYYDQLSEIFGDED
jgi:hypothetical protein